MAEPAFEGPADPAPARPRSGRDPLYPLLAVIALGVVVLVACIFWLIQLLRAQTPSLAAVDGVKPLLVLQGPGTGAHPTFDRPLGVAFDGTGRIFVADTGNDRVCVFDGKGRFLREWGSHGSVTPDADGRAAWKPGLLDSPVGIATDAAGLVYVADLHNRCIEVFDADGKWVRRFPDPAKPFPGGAREGGIPVTSVAVSGDVVFATDDHQVLQFTTSGEPIRRFGRAGDRRGELDHPNAVCAGAGGTVYVADSNHGRISAYTAEGRGLWVVGRDIEAGDGKRRPALDLPRGIAQLPDGDLVVVDSFDFGLVRLTSSGELVRRYGARGTSPGTFNFPNGIAAFGSTLAVADKENDRVQVLRLLGR